VDINQAREDGNTLLLNAINGRNTEVALAFIPKVEDINHTNRNGYSALTLAVRRANHQLFDKLLAAGADAKLLDKKGNNLAAHLFETFNGQEEAFEKLLNSLAEQGVQLTTTQENKNTLLHIAVERQHPFLIEQAIKAGVDLDAKNNDGLTAMHLAAMKAKDPSLLTLLMEKGADKHIKTDFDESVLDLAMENEFLKDAGFNLEMLKK
jgi:ankyrin repeat protein